MISTAGRTKVTVIPAKIEKTLSGNMRTTKLRVAAYYRVSSGKDEQLNSFEVQVDYHTDKINDNPDWIMADIFADEGITGTSMKRQEQLKKLLRACRDGRVDLILVKSVSRFGRNTIDTMRTLRALKERGIGVIF